MFSKRFPDEIVERDIGKAKEVMIIGSDFKNEAIALWEDARSHFS